jgi:hypothetical protein
VRDPAEAELSQVVASERTREGSVEGKPGVPEFGSPVDETGSSARAIGEALDLGEEALIVEAVEKEAS